MGFKFSLFCSPSHQTQIYICDTYWTEFSIVHKKPLFFSFIIQ
nr:MAG TPA: hypothetical protein [Caudoviricetes sp.]